MPVNDYSTTPASNTAINGVNIAEGCPPANVNDAIRQAMADIATWRNGTAPTQTFPNPLGVASGGTGVNSVPAGQLLVGAGTANMVPLATGSDGQVLGIVSGAPAFVDPAGLSPVPLLITSSRAAVRATPLSSVDAPFGAFGFDCVALDAQRDLLVWSQQSSGVQAVVWDHSSDTCGDVVTVRAGANLQFTAAANDGVGVVATLAVEGESLHVVALVTTGLVISVGSAATATIAASTLGAGGGNPAALSSAGMKAHSNSFVFTYSETGGTVFLRGCSVAAGVVTLGAAVSVTSIGASVAPVNHMTVSVGRGLIAKLSGSTFTLVDYSIAGAVLALGSPVGIPGVTSPIVARFGAGGFAITSITGGIISVRLCKIGASIIFFPAQTLAPSGANNALLPLADGRILASYEQTFCILTELASSVGLSTPVVTGITSPAPQQVGDLVWTSAGNQNPLGAISVAAANPVLVTQTILAGPAANSGAFGLAPTLNTGSAVSRIPTLEFNTPSAGYVVDATGRVRLTYFPSFCVAENGLARINGIGPRAYAITRVYLGFIELRRVGLSA